MCFKSLFQRIGTVFVKFNTVAYVYMNNAMKTALEKQYKELMQQFNDPKVEKKPTYSDLAAIKSAGKATTMMVVITNMDHVNKLTLNPTGHVTSGDLIGAAE